MTALHVQARPFPGHVPAPAPDPSTIAAGGLAEARQMLTTPAGAGHGPDCRCSVWCRDEWEYFAGAIGACATCGEPCRSTDPQGRLRHPTCEVPA